MKFYLSSSSSSIHERSFLFLSVVSLAIAGSLSRCFRCSQTVRARSICSSSGTSFSHSICTTEIPRSNASRSCFMISSRIPAFSSSVNTFPLPSISYHSYASFSRHIKFFHVIQTQASKNRHRWMCASAIDINVVSGFCPPYFSFP